MRAVDRQRAKLFEDLVAVRRRGDDNGGLPRRQTVADERGDHATQ